LCRTYEWNRAQPETVAVFEDAGKRLRAAGASVREVALPAPFAGLAEAQTSIMVSEVAKSLAYENLTHRKQLSADMTKMIDAGLAVSPQQYDAARSLTRACRAMLPKIFSEVDVLLAPSTAGEAPAGIDATGDPLFNRIWTLLHVPVVHVPFAHGPHGLPVGVTVAGAVGDDRTTLRAADWIHARLGGSEQARE
jgi:amidase